MAAPGRRRALRLLAGYAALGTLVGLGALPLVVAAEPANRPLVIRLAATPGPGGGARARSAARRDGPSMRSRRRHSTRRFDPGAPRGRRSIDGSASCSTMSASARRVSATGAASPGPGSASSPSGSPAGRSWWNRRGRVSAGCSAVARAWLPSATSSRDSRDAHEHHDRRRSGSGHPGHARSGDRRQDDGPRAGAYRDARQRAHPDRGLPGTRQDAHREAVRASPRPRVQAHPVHARSAPQRRDGQLPLRPAGGAVRVSPGAGVHPSAAGRRDQPRDTQDAGSAARGDAGGAGHGRRRALPPRPAFPRDRHAEPDRPGGHLPAAGSSARPLPDPRQCRLSDRRRGARDPGAAAQASRGRGARDGDHHPRRVPRHAAGARGGVRRRGHRAVHRGTGPGDAPGPAGSPRGLAPWIARAAQARKGPGSARAPRSSSRRTTSRRWPSRRSRTGSSCAPSCGCRRCRRCRWWRTFSPGSRRRRRSRNDLAHHARQPFGADPGLAGAPARGRVRARRADPRERAPGAALARRAAAGDAALHARPRSCQPRGSSRARRRR